MTSRYGGYMGRLLHIDLTRRSVVEYPVSDREREQYLGGKVLAARILYDLVPGPVDPFGPENPLVITTGPLTGSGAPMASRFNLSTVSPLTGYLASSNCGGSFGLHLKKAGVDGLVITGAADRPVWIEITEDGVSFHDAGALWGSTTGAAQAALPERAGKLVIGPAGENRVRYAGVFSGDRSAGRAGVGAVMGAKNLKGIAARGSLTVPVADPERARRIHQRWVRALQQHPITGRQLPRLGTAGLVAPMQATRTLATRNFARGRFEGFERVSGEALAEHLVNNQGCVTCPVQCGRQVTVNGRRVKGPELETLGLLGPNLENDRLDLILRWNLELEELGMDTISTGGTIAFAMELNEKGLWNNGLRFGEVDRLSDVFRQIAHREGIGDLLAEGVRRLAERFGGHEFAMHVKGLEMPAYEPRGAVGQGLGYAVANRGACHLNAGYVIVLEALGLHMDPYTPRAKAAFTIFQQNLMEAVSAVGNCLFSTYMLLPAPLLNNPNSLLSRLVDAALPRIGWAVQLLNRAGSLPVHLSLLPLTRSLEAVTGMKMDLGRLKRIGERGYNLERLINLRLGLTAAEDRLPRRLTEEEQVPGDPRTKVPLEVMRREYYRLRGWDESGVPTPAKRRELGLP